MREKSDNIKNLCKTNMHFIPTYALIHLMTQHHLNILVLFTCSCSSSHFAALISRCTLWLY